MATTARPAMTRLDEAWWEALFASGLQPPDVPTIGLADAAITRACECKWYANGTQPHSRYCSVRGYAGRMARESGDQPEAAARRMRCVRQLIQPPARPLSGPGPRPGGPGAARGPVAA